MANGQPQGRPAPRQNRPQRVERPPVKGGGGGPPRRAMGGGGGAPPQGRSPARPSPAPRGMPQGGGANGEREAKNMAVARTSEATGMPPEALQSFSLLELQVLPSILQKMSAVAEGGMPEGQSPTAPPQGGRGSGGPSAPKGQSMRPPSKQQANDEFAREIPMKSPARGRQPVMR
jgi:hypothetical protein